MDEMAGRDGRRNHERVSDSKPAGSLPLLRAAVPPAAHGRGPHLPVLLQAGVDAVRERADEGADGRGHVGAHGDAQHAGQDALPGGDAAKEDEEAHGDVSWGGTHLPALHPQIRGAEGAAGGGALGPVRRVRGGAGAVAGPDGGDPRPAEARPQVPGGAQPAGPGAHGGEVQRLQQGRDEADAGDADKERRRAPAARLLWVPLLPEQQHRPVRAGAQALPKPHRRTGERAAEAAEVLLEGDGGARRARRGRAHQLPPRARRPLPGPHPRARLRRRAHLRPAGAH
mmetsp:Transcript_16931/g.36810  ORF Transcript_16931/g.36810 Transcript_16931/m.36810 type:complete len:284 (+) Transcript_16931:644-1495(+)